MGRRSPNCWSVGDLVSVPGREIMESVHNRAMVPEPIDCARIKAIAGKRALLEVEGTSHFGVRVHTTYPFDDWQPLSKLVEAGH